MSGKSYSYDQSDQSDQSDKSDYSAEIIKARLPQSCGSRACFVM